MKRFYIPKEDFDNCQITGDEFNHLKNVLRMKQGDEFVAICNDEYNYHCEIISLEKHSATFKIKNKEINNQNPKIKIDLFQALAKGEKLDLITQKSTEIGVNSIYPIYLKNCDVKQNTTKILRLEKIAISACKQCGRSIVPTINECITIKELQKLSSNYDLILIANEREKNQPLLDCLQQNKSAIKIAIIVGPEGGFTDEELDIITSFSQSITLGTRILRTETAPIYLLSVLSAFYKF